MMMMMMMMVVRLLFRLIIIGRWYLYLLLRFKMSTLPINVSCAHVFIFARLYSRTRLKQNVLSTHHQISVFAFVAFVMDVMQSVRVHVVMMDFWRVERTWKLNERSEKSPARRATRERERKTERRKQEQKRKKERTLNKRGQKSSSAKRPRSRRLERVQSLTLLFLEF